MIINKLFNLQSNSDVHASNLHIVVDVELMC